MSLFHFVFGRRPSDPPPPKKIKKSNLPVLGAAPEDADWHEVKPLDHNVVQAKLARTDGSVRTGHGMLSYKAGEHFIVTHKDGATSVVRKDIFEKTYRRRWLGGYEKRPDLRLRYFTLPHAAMVETEEGPQRAEPGDWIMQGVEGELWPINPDEAERKYAPA